MLKYIALIVTIAVMNNVISITPGTPTPVYFGLITIVAVIGVGGKNLKFNGYLVALVIGAIISIIINDIPAYFNAPMRLVLFIIALLTLSPLAVTQSLITMRQYIFRFVNIVLIIIVFLSIAGRFTGVFSGMAGGIFRGITVHSMMLGPIAALVLLISVFRLYKSHNKNSTSYFYILMIPISFISLLLASSRTAIMGAVFSLILFFYFYYRRRIGKLLGVFIVTILILSATSSVWMGYTERVQIKNEANEQNGGMLSSREEQWNYRIAEFKSSPVTGIGFATLHNGLINKKNGVIEPATSWLAIFSMIGLLGGIPFVLLILSLFKKLWINKMRSPETSLLAAMLGFFVIHWFAEGYIFAAGGFLFFYSWLLLGVIDIYNNLAFSRKK